MLYTDGGARGNPGPSGIGAVLCGEDGKTIDFYKEFIGTATNNEAEYKALIAGLKLAQKHKPARVTAYMDSLLICNQMLGIYRVKHEGMKPLHREAAALTIALKHVSFVHIPREENNAADKLVNEAIDEALKNEKTPHKPGVACGGQIDLF
jgi:ribonuclease HI